MRCEGPLTEQERPYREYSWKAASTRTADIGHLGTTRIIFSAPPIIALTPPAWQKSGWHTEISRHIRLAVRLPRAHHRHREGARGPRRDHRSENMYVLQLRHRSGSTSCRVPISLMIPASAWNSSQLICVIDSLDGKLRFHNASHASDWAYLRFEFAARSMRRHRRMGPENSPARRNPSSVRRLLLPMKQRAHSAWQISSQHRANDPATTGVAATWRT